MKGYREKKIGWRSTRKGKREKERGEENERAREMREDRDRKIYRIQKEDACIIMMQNIN